MPYRSVISPAFFGPLTAPGARAGPDALAATPITPKLVVH
jgi:hypothetical protein